MNQIIQCMKSRCVWSSRFVAMSGPIHDSIERYVYAVFAHDTSVMFIIYQYEHVERLQRR